MPPALVARILESEPIRKQANKFGQGVSPTWDHDNHVCAIEFDSERFTREMAETWLREHDYGEATIEERVEIKETKRVYGYNFATPGAKFERTPPSSRSASGGLRIKGVKLLAAGTWTDSAQKTPCEYSPEILKQFSGNWYDNAIWSRHFGGVGRRSVEKIGLVENPRFESDAVVGDIFFHGLDGTDSPGTISMIDEGLINFVSVETISKDKWNVGKKVYQAQEIAFTGVATVNQGACRVCKIRDNEADMKPREEETVTDSGSLENLRDKIRTALNEKFPSEYGMYVIATLPDQVIYEDEAGKKSRVSYSIENDKVTFGDPVEVTIAYQDITESRPGAFEEEMDEKELEAKFEAMKKELSDSSDQKIKELEEKLAASETERKELAARLEKVEKAPLPPGSLSGAGGEAKELEMPVYRVSVDGKGTVRRV